jgi:hypothetical protein
MKLQVKIVLVIFFVTVVIAFINPISRGSIEKFYIGFGLTAFAIAFISFLISIILFIGGKYNWGQGFIISAGLLFLIGFATCGPMVH